VLYGIIFNNAVCSFVYVFPMLLDYCGMWSQRFDSILSMSYSDSTSVTRKDPSLCGTGKLYFCLFFWFLHSHGMKRLIVSQQ